jgi:hypothetical protein
MAIFQLEISDTDVQRVFDAICGNYGWQSDVVNPLYEAAQTYDEDGDAIMPVVDEGGVEIPSTMSNPETQGDFTHRKVREFLAEHVTAYEVNAAKMAAAAALDASVVITDPAP